MDFKKIGAGLALLSLLFSVPIAHAFTLSGGRLVEDFSTDDFADYTSSTGVWNTIDHGAQAAAVANAASTRVFTFGDGSDGVLDVALSGGTYTFDTTSHPNGFNYRSVNITGNGTVTATGTNALIIRSLTTINIAAAVTIDVSGVAGTNSVQGNTTGPSGGTARTCPFNTGGAGGGSSPLTAGGDGLDSLGAVNETGGVAAGGNTNFNSTSSVGLDLDTAANFICGGGGGGGGGNSAGTGVTGASGGAGGGRLRLIAMGNLTVGAINANGGDSGRANKDAAITACAGAAGSGNGGTVWLQTLKTLTASAPNIAEGVGLAGLNGCAVGQDGGGVGDGQARADANATAGGIGAATFATTNAASGNRVYVVQSKAYDLGTVNASFSAAPSVTTTTPADSTVSVQYAGSTDGTSFSAFVSDITTLSNQSYRYLKFKVTLTTATAANLTPQVSQIALNYTDLLPSKIDLKLSAGCGTIENSSKHNRSYWSGLMSTAPWLGFWILAYFGFRYWAAVRKPRRPDPMIFPA